MSTPAAAASASADKAPSADKLLERAVIVQMLEDGSFAPNYSKLADQLGLSRDAAKKRWYRYTLKLRKEAEDTGKPITIAEVRYPYHWLFLEFLVLTHVLDLQRKPKQPATVTPKKAKTADAKADEVSFILYALPIVSRCVRQ